MATAFQMPKLGLTMEAGTITQWLVEDGAPVTKGMAVLSIETDKVETEVESSGDGLLHQAGAVGDTFDCGETIGWFLAEGEAAPTAAPVEAAAVAAPADQAAVASASPTTPVALPRTGDRLFASPNARRVAAQRGIDVGQVVGSGPNGRVVSEDVLAAASTTTTAAATAPARTAGGGITSATFAARQLAELLGIDIATVSPSGVDPRIDRSDVARHVRQLLASPPSDPAPDPELPPLLQTPTSVVPLRGMRGTIAERMHTSLHDMAQLTLSMDVVMDAVIADRDRHKAAAAGTVPGFTDYVIAAAAAALQTHPVVNSQLTAEGVALLPGISVGMAVAVDGGLVVPIVHHTDRLSLLELSDETTRLAEAARAGGLQFTDLEGGTFSVTALGMFGVDMFTPIINPPNTAILGVGRIRDEVDWIDGEPVRISVLTLSLTWDHRAFDGAPAAEFTAAIKTNLESLPPTS